MHQAELIEAPLSREELAARYRALCDDPCYASVPGKMEIDAWGRLLMSPPAVYHGLVQARLVARLSTLQGEVIVEAPIACASGLYVTDVAWASPAFMRTHRGKTPLMSAPEICIEVVSPSNSSKELEEKRAAYLQAGGEEVWLIYPRSHRCEFFGCSGRKAASDYPVDLAGLFEQL